MSVITSFTPTARLRRERSASGGEPRTPPRTRPEFRGARPCDGKLSTVSNTRRVNDAIRRLAASLERFASRRSSAPVLFAIACVAYAVRAIAWPLQAGRDLDEYIYAWVQLFDHDVLLPWSLLFRTPATPVFVGAALDAFDGRCAEPLLAVLYAGSIVCWAAAARYFGAWAAIAVAAVLLLYQGYALMFHEISSEPLFAAT